MSYHATAQAASKDEVLAAFDSARVVDQDEQPNAPETRAQIAAVRAVLPQLLDAVASDDVTGFYVEVSGHAVTDPQPVERTVMVPALDAEGAQLVDAEGNAALVPSVEMFTPERVTAEEVVHVTVRALRM